MRFFESYPWRFIVTNLNSHTLANLDHFCTDRTVVFTRAAPTVISGKVPADNPEVNLDSDGGDPLLAEGTRLVYGFRRDGTTQPWNCRAAGVVLEVKDQASGDSVPSSGFVAYDPWKYLYRRPVTISGEGQLPPEGGIDYATSESRGSSIIIQQLEWSEAADGPMFLDYGQTAFWNGSIVATEQVGAINFQRGSSIGELFDTLIATGTIEIKIDPVYDPINRPGIIGDLSIAPRIGESRPAAVFGWDQWPRNVVDVSRVRDGTMRANRIMYYAGRGGLPTTVEEDAASVAKFGTYFEQRFWPGQEAEAAVQFMAQRALVLLAEGQYTYTVAPSAERSPIPLIDYHVGDEVPLYASRNLREPIATDLRVESIPLDIGNDQMERVTGLFVSVPEVIGS